MRSRKAIATRAPHTPLFRTVSKRSPLAHFFYHNDGSARLPLRVVRDETFAMRGVWTWVSYKNQIRLTNPLKPIELRVITLETGTTMVLKTLAGTQFMGPIVLSRDQKIYESRHWGDACTDIALPDRRWKWQKFLEYCTGENRFHIAPNYWQIKMEDEQIVATKGTYYVLTFAEFATILSIIKAITTDA